MSDEHRSAELRRDLDQVRLPSKADRNRALLGHVKSTKIEIGDSPDLPPLWKARAAHAPRARISAMKHVD